MDAAKPKINLFPRKRIIIIYISLYILQYGLYICQANHEIYNVLIQPEIL